MIFDAIRRWMGFGSDAEGGETPAEGPGGISCEDALARVYEYLDGELEEASHEQVEAHFEVCRRCYPHLASERSFRRALRRAIEGHGAPESVKSRVLALLEAEETAEGS